jgi:deazaflavin-dependent oxidoreductase (nitroreductase family)
VSQAIPAFREPNALERLFNKAFGVVVGWGLGPRDYYLLEVRGRRTGRVYATPVNVVEVGGMRFLVAPRGRTQWVRNAEAGGEVQLKRGSTSQRFRIRAVPDSEKLPVLRTYLDRFKRVVQRYFPVPAGAPLDAFAAIAERYPVFELLPSSDAERTRGERGGRA